MTEQQFYGEIAKMTMEALKSSDDKRGVLRLRQEGHFSPKMLNEGNILRLSGPNLVRLFLNLAMELTKLEFMGLCLKITIFIWKVGDASDHVAENINKNHAGSPVSNH